MVVCCVFGGKFIVCSMVEVFEWDESFKNNVDLFGCFMQGVYGKV